MKKKKSNKIICDYLDVFFALSLIEQLGWEDEETIGAIRSSKRLWG